MNSIDIAWLAGLMEGEGTFRLWHCPAKRGSKTYKYSYPCLTLCSTDKDIISRAAGLLGVSFQGPYMAKKSTKPFWQLSRAGSYAVGWMMTLYPLLGVRRQAKIREVLDHWKNKGGK